MEESVRQLWAAFMWYAGISTTVTVGLFGWLAKIHSRIQIGDSIEKDLNVLMKDVVEIKDALKGSYDRPGLITKHYDLDKRVEVIEDRLKQ